MANLDGLDKLFFELASESRLAILHELQVEGQRMHEIARELNLTDTETCRQLQRLSEALLIQKQPDGTYTPTEYGKLLMFFSRSFEFASKFKRSLMERDIWRFPDSFIYRMGELSQTSNTLDQLEMVNIFQRIVTEGKEYLNFMVPIRTIQIIGEQAIARAQAQEGLHLRTLFSETKSNLEYYSQHYNPLVERRIISQLPATLIVSEKSAVVCLSGLKNQDYSVFSSADSAFLSWSNDLFDYHWQRATPYIVGKPRP